MTNLGRFMDKLRDSLGQRTFVKMTLSRGRGDSGLRNVYGRLVELKAGTMVSFTLRHANRDVTRNQPPADAPSAIEKWLTNDFEEAHLFTTTGDWKLRMEHGGEWKMKAARPTFAVAVMTAHDRPKVKAVGNAEFLVKLGVTATDGTARPGMADKLRQVERFVEILGHLTDGCALRDAKHVRVCDMGAGKAYLTFATHEFFRARGVSADVTGVEQRSDLVEKTNRIAVDLKLEELSFVQGAIGAFDMPAGLDVLIALHACDTATDDALAAGVRAGAKLIVAAPCCQKEVRREFLPPPVLAGVLRHGILAERQAELLTDGIRALALEAAGYSASVFEFISDEHTGKNVMIAATKRDVVGDVSAVRAELRALMDFFGLRRQRLVDALI